MSIHEGMVLNSVEACRRAVMMIHSVVEVPTFLRAANKYEAGRQFIRSDEWTRGPWASAVFPPEIA